MEDKWESQCNWCDVLASQVPNLLAHERTVHAKEINEQHLQEWGHEIGSPECKAYKK